MPAAADSRCRKHLNSIECQEQMTLGKLGYQCQDKGAYDGRTEVSTSPVWIQRQRCVRKTAGLLVWLNILGRKWRPGIIWLCELVDSEVRRLRVLGILYVPQSGSYRGRLCHSFSLSASGVHSMSACSVDAAGRHSLVIQPARLWTAITDVPSRDHQPWKSVVFFLRCPWVGLLEARPLEQQFPLLFAVLHPHLGS